eukprot:3692823-Pleurochrysis_carterae.AAC.2
MVLRRADSKLRKHAHGLLIYTRVSRTSHTMQFILCTAKATNPCMEQPIDYPAQALQLLSRLLLRLVCSSSRRRHRAQSADTEAGATHVLRKYELQQKLGKGAYAVVFKAIDKKHKSVVALKKIFDAFQVSATNSARVFLCTPEMFISDRVPLFALPIFCCLVCRCCAPTRWCP